MGTHNNFKLTNYHSHSHFSDGKGEPERYVQSAIQNNLYAYGFSDHSPVPFYTGWNLKFHKFREYLNEISRLKKKYRGQIKLYSGLEIDYINGLNHINTFKDYLDYTIGAVHFLGFFDNNKPWDFTSGKNIYRRGLKELFGNNIKKLVKYYFEQINTMVSTESPDIIAHFDIIKKYNKGNHFFNENDKWYRDTVFESLEIITQSNSIIEINTRGVLKGLEDEFYPSNFILDRCKELNIKLCLNTDTHHPNEVAALLPEAKELLTTKGFKEVFIFDEQGWYPVAIK